MKTSVLVMAATLSLSLVIQDSEARENRDREVKSRSSYSQSSNVKSQRDSNVRSRHVNRENYSNSKPRRDSGYLAPERQVRYSNANEGHRNSSVKSNSRYGEVRERTDDKSQVTHSRHREVREHSGDKNRVAPSRHVTRHDDGKKHPVRVEHRREWKKDKQRHFVDKYRHYDRGQHSWHRSRLHNWRKHYHSSHHYRNYHRHGYYYRPYRSHYVTIHHHYPVWVYDYYYDYLDEHYHSHHCPHWHFRVDWEDIAFGVIVGALLFD